MVFSWHPPNPDWSVGLLDNEARLVTPENMFPLLQSPVAACFTPLQPTLGIAPSDLRLVYLALETHFIKLWTHSFYADVVSRGSLESVARDATEDR